MSMVTQPGHGRSRESSTADREVSSLDRFLMSRAPVLAGLVDRWRRTLALAIVGGVYSAQGAVLLLVASAGGPHALAGVGIAFLTTGALVMCVSAFLRARYNPETASHVQLSSDAKGLVRELLTHLHGWPLGRLGRRRWLRRATRRGVRYSLRDRRSQDILTPEAFRVLDAAAREYNRIHAALGDPAEHSAGLDRLSPSVRAAADEAMVEILHTAALLNGLPEAGAARAEENHARIEELRELAEHVERLGAEDRSSIAPAPRIRALLSDLRAEKAAWAELQQEAARQVEEQAVRVGDGG